MVSGDQVCLFLCGVGILVCAWGRGVRLSPAPHRSLPAPPINHPFASKQTPASPNRPSSQGTDGVPIGIN